ncbi:kinase-like domain-containing protein [Rhizophagus irregularis DAOM 181602=DAOM 197198]|uniref:Kinase-like domain-containing protein n=1 Tax=Rhizophagus irregularis (strain DAOM 181602 / DAOM 197198 / MUCL 43194) TaxID=747089 RepID=A0A2P4PAP5_RHIID|nr:kinase-like domain-containing protein [Rhizophagus irregularis DAOM 181602=DAOM 197198]POG62458.1 kinase-like domain-containing protein [Rhizophagus irregularis DAOM 181602=DAOM 197198]|eukprot:XP_025169324.1 kinase-like domain-containing protein [Rhizophagus irregularis DAOM 181602=DAOM 197198]
MSVIREDLIYTTLNKARALTDHNIYNDFHKQTEFCKQTILADESLTKDEKSEAIRILTATYDRGKLVYNEGIRGNCSVVLKRLENVEGANKRWFEEANSHLNICNKLSDAIVQCYGLTKDPLNGDYMLLMNKLDTDLRKYLQQNHNQLTWKERIQIAADIILALSRVHNENAIHRDLHSGNILFRTKFNISDLGFCGPADKPLKSEYGNLPYIAPEVIAGKVTTFKSDIYSIGILMWEISSGQPPFINYEHNYDLAMYIINGIRPKIVSGTPLEYKNLMEQCWDANPSNRPDIGILRKRIRELNLDYQNKSNELLTQLDEDNSLEIVDDFDKLNNQKNNSKIISIFKVGSKKLSKIFKRNSKNAYQ